MSFAKAQDLLRLAKIAGARRGGVCLDEICEEFGVSHRTAQRMTDALEATFAGVEISERDDRRRCWRISDPKNVKLQPRPEATIEALEIAIRLAGEENRSRHRDALLDLRDDLISRLPRKEAFRTEADVEAVLGSLGHVMRPGPRVPLASNIIDAIIEGLRGPFRMQITYGSASSEPRKIEPHGLLMGPRSYLVARQPERGDGYRNFRIDRIARADCLPESFEFQRGFSLSEYSAQAFGAYHDEKQFGEVVWRFAPNAADRAAEFQFHPQQSVERQADDSLIVRFRAAGWLEMAWFLYQWGDAVEVLTPDALRGLTAGHRRSDFEAFP